MSTAAEQWIGHFPEAIHDTVRSWFTYALTTGARTPEAILMVVVRVVGHRLDWSTTPETRQLCHNTLQACVCNRPGALAYAAEVLREGQ